jgi:3-hydroxyisobutyrate dehydrogenase
MNKIGFIGLGNMGGPMASNLVASGLSVTGYDLNEEANLLAKDNGIQISSNIESLIEDIDVLITMLPASEHVEKVYLGENLLDKLDKSILIIDCSTIAPEISVKVASAAKEKGLEMIDAPVSGGVAGAHAGTLTFITGGSPKSIELATPVLKKMGNQVLHAGNNGSGQIAKICNNMLLAVHMCGTAEAIALGVKNGLDPNVISKIMQSSSGNNWSLDKYNPFPGIMPNAPSSNEYKGGFLNKLMLKDLGLAAQLSGNSNSETPMGDKARELYEELSEMGLEDLDFSSIQKKYHS